MGRSRQALSIVSCLILLASTITVLNVFTLLPTKQAEASESVEGSSTGESGDRRSSVSGENNVQSDPIEAQQFEFPDGTIWQVLTNPENVCLDPRINPDLVTIPDAQPGCLAPANSGSKVWWFGVRPLGSYIGESAIFPQPAKNGGESTFPAIFGNLVSPSFSPTPGNSSLMFATWWEIESVDADRFDLMRIFALVGVQFVEVTRLNPTSDAPWGQSDLHYASGYSGLGAPAVQSDPFLAPQWVNHMIELPEGTTAVMFRFSNNDALFNGFRGWMIDDIKVSDPASEPIFTDNVEGGRDGWATFPEIPGSVDIHINKFEDLNGDGFKDETEPSLVGWHFSVTDVNGELVCEGETMDDVPGTPDIDETGFFWCLGIDTASKPPPYTIMEELKPGFINTTPNPLLVTPFFTPLNITFGNVVPGEIHGMKWDDLNGNGLKDPNEPGIPGVTIELYRLFPPNNIGFLHNITLTDNDGNYWFTDVFPGSYRVREIVPQGRVQTFPPFGTPHIVSLNSSQILNNVDFGNHVAPGAEIHGMKFVDLNRNGEKDIGEPVIPNVLICLFDSLFFIPIDCMFTDGTGNYWFTNLPPGTYVVGEDLPFGFTNTTPLDQVVILGLGEIVEGVNFGNAPPEPPPPEVDVIGDTGLVVNGLSVIFWGSSTTYTKNVTLHCNGIMPVQVKLVIEMPETGGKFERLMTKMTDNPMTPQDESQIWTVTFLPFFPHHGVAILTFFVDCPPDTMGFPENVLLISFEDEIQMGGNVYIDPSGTILDACTNEPLAGAAVTLLKESPPGSGMFVIPLLSDHIPSTNPQTTGADGAYGWVVVPGVWKVRAEKTGFVTGESQPLSIPPAVTDLNISLQRVGGCAPIFLKGDPDGNNASDVFDMIFIGNHIVGNIQFNAIQFAGADVSPVKDGNPTCGNNIVDIFDMILEGQAIVTGDPLAFFAVNC